MGHMTWPNVKVVTVALRIIIQPCSSPQLDRAFLHLLACSFDFKATTLLLCFPLINLTVHYLHWQRKLAASRWTMVHLAKELASGVSGNKKSGYWTNSSTGQKKKSWCVHTQRFVCHYNNFISYCQSCVYGLHFCPQVAK